MNIYIFTYTNITNSLKQLTLTGNIFPTLCQRVWCPFSFAPSLIASPPLLLLNGWKKRTTTRCTHCNNHETLHHILNSCSVFLNRGRSTWWYNSILQHLALALGSAYSSLNSAPQIYADLPGYLSSTDSTVPSHILPTSQHPNFFLLFPNRKIYIIELTTPFESNFINAHTRQHDCYASLISVLHFPPTTFVSFF